MYRFIVLGNNLFPPNLLPKCINFTKSAKHQAYDSPHVNFKRIYQMMCCMGRWEGLEVSYPMETNTERKQCVVSNN